MRTWVLVSSALAISCRPTMPSSGERASVDTFPPTPPPPPPSTASPALEGLVDVRWGEDVAVVAARLAMTCSGPEDGGPKGPCVGGPLLLRGHRAVVELAYGRAGVDAVIITFLDCDPEALQQQVAAAIEVTCTPGAGVCPYTVASDGEVVHLDKCTLVVSDARYGTSFQAREMREGLGGLFRTR